MTAAGKAISLQNRVTCPHCWQVFPPEKALWVAEHPDLLGDPRLGRDHPPRFLPTRFTIDGAAIDSRGFPCHQLACPNCHLTVPRAMFEMRSTFLSILGAPSSGKSYFLASMTWQMRKALPTKFAIDFGDADPLSNLRLHEYEELQFLNPNPDALVAIEKTETQGDLYDTVLFGDQAINYPRPFLFRIAPRPEHPNSTAADRLSHVLCMYDNAGESFLPGQDTASSPVTRHLAQSQALFFTFDPTQDPRFRTACQGKSNDPQMKPRSERLQRERPVRQETILLEAASRVRRYAGLAQSTKHRRPLIIIVTKYDSWMALLDGKRLANPWGPTHGALNALRIEVVEEVSQRVRDLLWRLSPEIVSAAEGFAEQVLYVPVSATGCNPEVDPRTGAFGVRPKDMNPMWVEVPPLYFLAKGIAGLVPLAKSRHDVADSSANDSLAPPPRESSARSATR